MITDIIAKANIFPHIYYIASYLMAPYACIKKESHIMNT